MVQYDLRQDLQKDPLVLFLSNNFHYSCHLKTLAYHRFVFVSEAVVQAKKASGLEWSSLQIIT